MRMTTHIGEAARRGVIESGKVDWQDDLGLSCGNYWSIVRRRSSLTYGSSNACSSLKLSRLITIVIQLVFLSTFCQANVFSHGWFSSPKVHRGLASAAQTGLISNPNCTKLYYAAEGETCESLRTSQNLSQPEIFELNPGLNCKTLFKGQAICVQGPSAHCGFAITVTAGQTNASCESIEANYNVSSDALKFLNPGISCPAANNAWPNNNTVCVSPGLGNLFFEYIGLPSSDLNNSGTIPLQDLEPLVQKYPSVVYYYILAPAVDNDTLSVPGTYSPQWSSALTPAAIKTFKATNPGVQILMSVGGPVSADKWPNPANVTEWLDIAQASLTTIIEEYSIDGIDISYQPWFGGNTSTFAFCMGNLIQRLKGNNTIGLATIAPVFLDNNPEPYGYSPMYQKLMITYPDLVDYVNFQFYSESLTGLSGIALYDYMANQFDPRKLTYSTYTGPDSNVTTFLDTVNQIQQARGLPGVMLFPDYASIFFNFTMENSTLALLSGVPYNDILGLNSSAAGGRRFFTSRWHAVVTIALLILIQ